MQPGERSASRGSGDAGGEILRAALRASRCIDLSGVLGEVASDLARWAGASAAFAFVPDREEEGEEAIVVAASSLAVGDPRRVGAGRAEGLRVEVDEEGEPCEGLGPFEGVWAGWPGERPGSGFVFPVRDMAGTAVAWLLLLEPEAAAGWRADALALLEEVRPAVANALAVRSVRELVIKDDTADCFNRRHFEQFIVEEIARSSRFRTPLSLIFFDMDNLKEVNSRLGHAMGSRTLWEVSSRVRTKIRRFDKLFRFGGDEFCIVLPETEWHGALEVAERVREAISGEPFLVAEQGRDGAVPMTASFGVASFPLHARTKAELVQRADRAMQRIKNGPKNAIAVAEVTDGPDSGD